MALSYFYIEPYDESQKELVLGEETSRHIVQVLRMKEGEQLNLTDGKGMLLLAAIKSGHKKHCEVRILSTEKLLPLPRKVIMAVSLLKNNTRFEWFLEKATELGVSEIVPLLCERTIKEKFRYDRMQQICISAMLQSQQAWLPVLHQPMPFDLLFRQEEILKTPGKLIAHCNDDPGRKDISSLQPFPANTSMLIGPEGDFTTAETALAIQHGFIPVSLGATRLRTETAAVVAASLLCLV